MHFYFVVVMPIWCFGSNSTRYSGGRIAITTFSSVEKRERRCWDVGGGVGIDGLVNIIARSIFHHHILFQENFSRAASDLFSCIFQKEKEKRKEEMRGDDRRVRDFSL